jgi:hypothetical protein
MKDLNRARRTGVHPVVAVALAVLLLLTAVPATQTAAGAATDKFQILVSPADQQISPGGSTGYTVDVTWSGGFTDAVQLSIDPANPLPAGLTASFSKTSVTPSAPQSILTITAATTFSSSTPVSIVVLGKSGSLTNTSNAATVLQVSLVPKCLVDVTVKVTEQGTSTAIAGATVSGGGKSATAGAEAGTYILKDVTLNNGNAPKVITVTAQKNQPATNKIGEYWSKSTSITISPPANVADCESGTRGQAKADLALVKVLSAKLSGSVFEGTLGADNQVQPTTTPIGGANTTVSGVASATTGADGGFVYKDTATGVEGIHLGADNAPLDATVNVTKTSATPGAGYWASSVKTGTMVPGQTYSVKAYMVKECTAPLTVNTVDKADGKPLGTVTLQIRSADPLYTRAVSATTSETGTVTRDVLFGFNNVPHAMKISASKTGYKAVSNQLSEVLKCGGPAVPPVKIEMERTLTPIPAEGYGSLTGLVKDKDTGAGIAGVTVAFSACAPRKDGDCATQPTGADGKYTITNIPVGESAGSTLTGKVSPSPVPADYWTASVDVTVKADPNPSPATDLLLVKKRYASLTGTVTGVNEDGKSAPLPGAKVTVLSSKCPTASAECIVTTGPDGTYSVAKIEVGTNNATVTKSVRAELADYWTKTASASFAADGKVVVDLALVKKCAGGTITGKVTSAATGNPVAGVTVATSGVTSVKTDTSGSFTLSNVPAGTDNAPRTASVSFSQPDFYTLTQSVTVECGKTVTLSPSFGNPPAITSITPNKGPATGGTTVTLTGTNMALVNKVFFGETEVIPTGTTTTSATAVTPPGAAGTTVPVTVQAPAGTSGPVDFTYEAVVVADPPTVSAISPDSGPAAGGTEVTLTGANLATATTVLFGTQPATFVGTPSATQIKVLSPAGTAGTTVGVTVQAPAGTSAPVDFRYLDDEPPPPPAPNVTGIEPNEGPEAGGTVVIITGSGFTGVTTVSFGSEEALEFEFTSDTEIRAVAPGGKGAVNVTVTTPQGTSAAATANLFTYLGEEPPPPAAPTVTAIDPNEGPETGGTSVTITGTGFTGATSVRFGAKEATTYTVLSTTSISATSPAGIGAVNVTVTTTAGTSAGAPANLFTYLGEEPPPPAAPTVTAIDPNEGPETGGTSVTITGTGFTGATSVAFGTIASGSVEVVSATEIRAISPPQASGPVDVRVSTPAGTSATSTQATFTYVAEPSECPGKELPKRIQANMPLGKGKLLSIDLTRVPLPAGIGSTWMGVIQFKDPQPGSKQQVRLSSVVMSTEDVVEWLPGSCSTLRIVVDAVDLGSAGPSNAPLVVLIELPEDGSGPFVSIVYPGITLAGLPAKGRISIT